MLPVYATYYVEKKEKEFLKLFKRTIVIIVVLSFLALGGAALLEDMILPILFGEEIVPYIYMFKPMLVCTILNAVVWFQTSILVVIRDFKSYFWGTLFAVILSILIGYPLIQKYSMNGVNYVLFIIMLIQISIFGVVLGIRFKKNFKNKEV